MCFDKTDPAKTEVQEKILSTSGMFFLVLGHLIDSAVLKQPNQVLILFVCLGNALYFPLAACPSLHFLWTSWIPAQSGVMCARITVPRKRRDELQSL